jgi:hypothetical protein
MPGDAARFVWPYFCPQMSPVPIVMSKFPCLLFVLALGQSYYVAAQDMPPDAQPGKCYAKCMIPDHFEIVTDQVVVRPAGKRYRATSPEIETKVDTYILKDGYKRLIPIPAEYEKVTEEVQVKEPGKRFVVTQAVYEATNEMLPNKPESKRLVAVPAEYETVQKQIQIKPAITKLTEIPAVYETVEESYVVEEGYTRYEILEPAFETVMERIEVRAASAQWVKKQADANCLSADPDDCLVWCMIETPAEYKTITKKVNRGCDGSGKPDAGCLKTIQVPAKMGNRTVQRIKTPATVKEETTPAEYRTFSVRKIKTPAYVKEEIIPAEKTPSKKMIPKSPASVHEEEIQGETVTITREIIKTPASTRTEIIPAENSANSIKVVRKAASLQYDEIPAETVSITRRQLIKPGGFYDWREILCGEKITGYTIRQIQEALNKKGYDIGVPDNVMGAKTKAALIKFQRDHRLPEGQLDMETLKALGIN